MHGVGEAVGQSIKTASLAFLCAGLTKCHPLDGLDTADKVLAALAAFDAAAFFFEVKGGRNRGSDEAESGVTLLSTPDNASLMNRLGLADGSLRIHCYPRRNWWRVSFPDDPLVLVHRGGNSASHATQVTWAQFRYICWQQAPDVALQPFKGVERATSADWVNAWGCQEVSHFYYCAG